MHRIKPIGLCLIFLLLALSAAAESGRITLVAAGDLLLGGSAAATVSKQGFDYPFRDISAILQSADIAMANLEAPLTRQMVPVADKRFTFKVDPQAAGALQRAGFTVLTLANNHIGDFGPDGVIDTIAALRPHGLRSTGAGADLGQARKPTALATPHGKVGFLAYSNTLPKDFYATTTRPGTAPGYPDFVRADIERLRRFVDYVVVSFHWGAELMVEPKDYQRRLARLAIDSGAQVVIGHHPHVLQGVEFYNDGVIYYSLGNFAFGSWSRNALFGGLARVTLSDGKVEAAQILPLNVANYEVQFQPRPLTDDTGFAADFDGLCTPLGVAMAKKETDGFWTLTESRPQLTDNEHLRSAEELTAKKSIETQQN